MLSDAGIYVLDSSSMGLFKVMNKPNVRIYLRLIIRSTRYRGNLERTQRTVADCQDRGGDVKELINS